MSTFTRCKQKFISVSSLLKQNKIQAALTCVFEAVQEMMRANLLTGEKNDLRQFLQDSLYYLNNNQQLREIYPVVIEYHEGNEKQLLAQLKEIIDLLQEKLAREAKEQLAALERKKKKSLATAQDLLQKKSIDEAELIFKQLIEEFDKDFQLKIDISDILINAQHYKRAIKYLKLANEQQPNSVHVFNRLGMILRKLGKYEQSEKAYLQALKLDPDDEYLYFNVGRLYIDSQNWEKAAQMAQKAVNLNPQFKQAKKMLSFVQKKLEQGGEGLRDKD